MPWYIRKSFSRGPIRLNLSKSGLGASFGVKGLRVGVGPKGTYVSGGRGGVYYRQYLNGAPVQDRSRTMLSSAAENQQAQGVEHVAVPAADDEVAADINARIKAFRWSRLTFSLAIVGAIWLAALNLWVAAALCVGVLMSAGVFQSSQESEHRRIEFNYDADDSFDRVQGRFVSAFQAASKCAAIWRVVTQSQSHDSKYTAGAGSIVGREPTIITFNEPMIKSNVQTVWLCVAGGKLCLLPDRMLFFSPYGVSSLKYPDVHIEATTIDFREDGRVPADSTSVGTTWQYVNKNGTPDRRFANNRQLPILRYSDFLFKHPQLSFRLEFSRVGVADLLVGAMGLVTKPDDQAIAVTPRLGILTSKVLDEDTGSVQRTHGLRPESVADPAPEGTRTQKWAVLQLAGLLDEHFPALQTEYDQGLSGDLTPVGIQLSHQASVLWLGDKIAEIQSCIRSVIPLVEGQLEMALSATEDVAQATAAQSRWLHQAESCCNNMIDWEISVKTAHLDPLFENVHALMRGLTREPFLSIMNISAKLKAFVGGNSGAEGGTMTTVLTGSGLQAVTDELVRLEAEIRSRKPTR